MSIKIGKPLNPLQIPAGEDLPPLEQILEAAREEALNLDNAKNLWRNRPPGISKPAEIIFVGDHERFGERFQRYIARNKYGFRHAPQCEQVWEMLGAGIPDLLVANPDPADSTPLKLYSDLHSRHPEISVVALMKDADPRHVADAFRAGVADVLIEPVDAGTLSTSMDRCLQKRRQGNDQLQYQHNLERIVNERTSLLINYMEAHKRRTKDLSTAFHDVVNRLGRAAQWRDDETGNHTVRIGLFAARVAERLGLSKADVDLLREAAPLHDIGKIGVPDSILLKPGRLTPFEYEYMKTHTMIGAEILAGSEDPLLRASEAIALSHHEWFDGNGYPMKKSGADIPLFAKIVAVVDVYDALIHKRSYKKAVPLDQTIETMGRRRGAHFDPYVFDAFIDVVEDLVRIEAKQESAPSRDTKYDVQFGLHNMTKHLEQTWRVK